MIKKWTEELNRLFFLKENCRCANGHMKIYSTLLIIREINENNGEISPHACCNSYHQKEHK